MRHRRVVIAGSALALGAWCGWASGLRQSTTAAYVAWAVSLAGVVAVDTLVAVGRRRQWPALRLGPSEPWPRPGAGGAGRVLLGLSPWLVVTAVVAAWEALGIDTGRHEPHLTVSALALAFRPFDAALFFTWILLGVGYGVARARTPRPAPVDAEAAPAPRPSVGAIPVGSALGRHPDLVPALLLPGSRAVGVAFWLAVVVACSVIELVARRSDGRVASAGELARLISAPPFVNVVLVVAWAYAGWHLFAH